MGENTELQTSDRSTTRTLIAIVHDDQGELLRAGEVETWAVLSQSIDGHAVVSRVDTGAGHGNSRLSLLVEIDGERVAHEYVDIAALADLWVNAVVDAEMEKRKDSAS
jgi:hypothetical protein